MTFRRADQHGRLPVPLGAEAVALGHEPLHGEAGELAEAAEVLEARREGAEAALLEEGAKAELDGRAVAERLVPLPAAPQLGLDVVEGLVLVDQRVDLRVGRCVHARDEVVDAPGVDRDAELELGLRLVALGDRHVAHVVAEAGDLELVDRGPAGGGSHPRADAGAHGLGAHVADDRLADDAEARLDVAELAVAVRGLVQVHEVHVDAAPGQRDVGLRVQVEEGLLQGVQALDPHLRGAERVHPGDEADGAVARVGLEGHPADAVGVLEDGLPHDAHGDVRRLLELPGDLLRLLGDLLERLLAVEVLAAREEPDLVVVEGGGDAAHFRAPWGACP